MDGLRFNQESGTKVIVMHLFVLFIVPLPFSFMFEIWCQNLVQLAYCPIHVVTFTLISILATDYIQKRRGQALLF